jgi:hypothetical protein
VAIALAVSKSQAVVGDEIAVSGTGFTASGVVNIEVVQDGLGFKVPLTATVGGAISGLTLIPVKATSLTIKAHDVTADTDTSLVLPVFGGG